MGFKLSESAKEQIEATIRLDKIEQRYACFLCGKESKNRLSEYWMVSIGPRAVCKSCFGRLQTGKSNTGLGYGGKYKELEVGRHEKNQ